MQPSNLSELKNQDQTDDGVNPELSNDELSKSADEAPITINEFCDLVEKEDKVHAQLLSNSMFSYIFKHCFRVC